MQKQTFYQKDTKDKVRVWTIEVVHVDDTLSNIVTTTSILNEPTSLIPTTTPITSGKNIGRSNETTIAKQAEFDAQTEINKKVKNGYTTDLTQVKAKNETATIKKPMKGEAYHPSPDPTNKKDKRLSLDKLEFRGKDLGIQRKLDGWRYRIHITRTSITYFTSSGDVTLEFPQISDSLRESFNKIIDYVSEKYGIEEYYLDGEMYRHGLKGVEIFTDRTEPIIKLDADGFNSSASACAAGGKKTSQSQLSVEQRALRDQMHFYIFDVCLDAPYTTREKVIKYFHSDVVVPVETILIKGDEQTIENLFNQFLSEGYEGLMIRTLDQPYEYKRSKQLTKYKPKDDDEFEIVGFKQSISGPTLGSLQCRMPDGTLFYANLKHDIGSDKDRKEIWDNQADYIGKWVTIEFMGYTQPKDGEPSKPRHPRAKAFRKSQSAD